MTWLEDYLKGRVNHLDRFKPAYNPFDNPTIEDEYIKELEELKDTAFIMGMTGNWLHSCFDWENENRATLEIFKKAIRD